MRTLYIDCGAGATESMIVDALLGLLPSTDTFEDEMNGLHIPTVSFAVERSECGGIGTSHLIVHQTDELADTNDGREDLSIRDLVSKLPMQVQEDVLSVFALLQQAQSRIAQTAAEQQFPADRGAVCTVIAISLLIQKLAPERICASLIGIGSGCVLHGGILMPLPLPVTAELLRGVPTCGGQTQREVCTPIAAAVLRHFAEDFGQMPVMESEKIGYGFGQLGGECMLCLRTMLAEAPQEIVELSCNVDDMTGETIGFALERFMENGALDAYTIPIGMKKSRPGIKICVLCRQQDRAQLVQLMLRHTTTLGVRETVMRRYALHRQIRRIDTPYGTVRRKESTGWGVCRSKYEYEDLARIAKSENLSIDQVLNMLTEL